MTAEGIQTLIEQKETLIDKLYKDLLGNTSSPEFSEMKRRIDLLGIDVEVLREKKHKLVEPDLEERPYINNISTGSVSSRVSISRNIIP